MKNHLEHYWFIYFFLFIYLTSIWMLFSSIKNLSEQINHFQLIEKVLDVNGTKSNETEFKIIKHQVEVTIYNAEECQTDSTPFITASNKKVKIGYIALSRDLEEKYNLQFGDVIYIPKLSNYEGILTDFFIFEDRMNKRFTNAVDIFLWSKKDAVNFGRKQFEIYIIKIRE